MNRIGCLLIASCTPTVAANWPGGTANAQLCTAPPPAIPLYFDTTSGLPAAVAICGDLAADNTLTVAPRATTPADVRVAGSARIASPLAVADAFLAGGDVDAPNTMTVGGFATAGNWVVSSPAKVFGDATVAGTVDHRNSIEISGKLRASSRSGTGAISAGEVHMDAPDVSAPLNCMAAPDISAIVTDARSYGDSTLDRAALKHVRMPTDLTLGCGRYYVSELFADSPLTIRVTGPTVLVVDGRMRIAAPTKVALADGASFELVVGGALEIDNTFEVGDEAHAGVVAVGTSMRIAAPTTIYGRIIAPRAEISADNVLDVFGAAYFGPTRVASPMTIHDGPAIGL